jgi:hypothetical protein
MQTNVTKLSVRTLIIATIAVLALTAILVSNRVSAATVATCSAAHLKLSLGASDGTAGTIYRHLVVQNTGTTKCQLTGYPAVFLLDSGNHMLGTGAASNALYTPVAVTLATGGKAHAVAGLPDAGNFDPGVCSAQSAKVRMYVPGVATPLSATMHESWCPGFSITALKAGS